jgi:RNA polymerase primary sigma factor
MRQFKISERLTPRNSKSAMMYLTEVERTKVLDPETEAKIANLAAEGDKKARELLVTSNLRFVLSVAKMYAYKPEDFVDLVSAGNEGLYEASGKFDPSKGFKFISFAIWYIRKEMIKFLSENSRTIKIPTNQTQSLRTIIDTSGSLSATEGREVSNEEALEFLKETNPKFKSLDMKLFHSVWVAEKRPASLTADLNSEKDAGTLLDIVPSEDFNSDELVLIENNRSTIEVLLNCLTPFERDLITRVFGIGQSEGFPESLEKISQETGYGTATLGTKIKISLAKMKKFSKKLNLEF